MRIPILITATAIFCHPLTGKVHAARCGSDFAEISESRYFVDKTRLITEFLAEGREGVPAVVMAPAGFGKSAALDMIRRFAGIVCEDNEEPAAANATENYGQFCEKGLDVCSDGTFVEKHLGQHPVLHVDYGLLGESLGDMETVVERMGKVVAAAFEQHAGYIGPNSTLFVSGKGWFGHYRRRLAGRGKPLKEKETLHALRRLTQLLYIRFGRKTVVLVDEYDAFYHRLADDESSEGDRILAFFAALNEDLLGSNPYVERALLTGVGLSPYVKRVKYPANFCCYWFAGEHRFAGYYGFSQDEVDRLLERLVADKTTREDEQNRIEHALFDHKERVYSPLAVIDYFEKNLKAS